jgi:hypothetical protein
MKKKCSTKIMNEEISQDEHLLLEALPLRGNIQPIID